MVGSAKVSKTAELELFRKMVRSRALEETSIHLWEQGLISGELHTSIGEEAVAAGVLAHLIDASTPATNRNAVGGPARNGSCRWCGRVVGFPRFLSLTSAESGACQTPETASSRPDCTAAWNSAKSDSFRSA